MNVLSLLLGCAVCMGGSDAKTGPAINGAIFLMLGCIGFMLALISCVAWSIARHARHYASGQSPLANLTPEKL